MTWKSVLYDTFVPLPPNPHTPSITLNSIEKSPITETTSNSSNESYHTQRKLSKRMIYLISFSGTIGTAAFISMGSGLVSSGSLSLLLGFIIWSIPILFITLSIGEMVCYLPVSSPFITMGGRCCDEALEITMGWNFWVLQAALIPYEVVGVNTIIHYWRDDYSPAIPLVVQIILYFFINVIAVEIYGEFEFWLSIGKVLLAVGIFLFSFITMCGGNPSHDKYGFRYYSVDLMKEYIGTGNWGRFLGLFKIISLACFTIAGPEYVAMTASETINPRVTLPKAFKTMFWRFTVLFVGLCLCMGIVCASNDPLLIDALKYNKPGAGSSPFLIAMTNLKIKILPDIFNGSLIIAAFSSGNSYTYTSSRTLYGLALKGHAPRIFSYCTKTGTPMFAILVSLIWSFLSFLQLSENSAKVLNYIVSLVTISQLLNYFYCCLTYTFFLKAFKIQKFDINKLTFKAKFQPWLSIIGGSCALIMCFLSGYEVFLKWDTKTFIFNYIMLPLNLICYLLLKFTKRKPWIKSEQVDLITGLKEIEDYEEDYYENYQKKKFFKW